MRTGLDQFADPRLEGFYGASPRTNRERAGVRLSTGRVCPPRDWARGERSRSGSHCRDAVEDSIRPSRHLPPTSRAAPAGTQAGRDPLLSIRVGPTLRIRLPGPPGPGHSPERKICSARNAWGVSPALARNAGGARVPTNPHASGDSNAKRKGRGRPSRPRPSSIRSSRIRDYPCLRSWPGCSRTAATAPGWWWPASGALSAAGWPNRFESCALPPSSSE